MRFRWQAWHVALIVVLLCTGVAGSLFWLRSRTVPSLVERLERLPAGSATMYLDLAVLRKAGLLEAIAGQRVTEDADYRQFVSATGFDYRTDLDSALVSWKGKATYIIATGRFDWKLIKEHTLKHGGTCQNGLCRMPASTPRRHVSYVPLHNGMIGMAVSDNGWEVASLQNKPTPKPIPVPDSPIWVAAEGKTIADGEGPAGTKLFAKALGAAKVVTFGIYPAGAQAEARLAAICKDDEDARALENQLRGVTEVFRKYLQNIEQKPNASDLSGVLTSGTFGIEGSKVTGKWALQQSFLDALLGGRL